MILRFFLALLLTAVFLGSLCSLLTLRLVTIKIKSTFWRVCALSLKWLLFNSCSQSSENFSSENTIQIKPIPEKEKEYFNKAVKAQTQDETNDEIIDETSNINPPEWLWGEWESQEKDKEMRWSISKGKMYLDRIPPNGSSFPWYDVPKEFTLGVKLHGREESVARGYEESLSKFTCMFEISGSLVFVGNFIYKDELSVICDVTFTLRGKSVIRIDNLILNKIN